MRDRIDGAIRRTRAGMVVERALRAFWPLGALAAAGWAMLAFGAAEAAPRTVLVGALAIAGLAGLALAVRGLLRFRWPSLTDARNRVDDDLPGRPLAAMADRPALGRDDPATLAVWNAHVVRMRRRAAAARAALPDLRLSREDPWALRLAALVALIAAAVFARGDAVAGLGHALGPSGAAAVATGPSFEAWAEPPGYTGMPTLYLPEVPSEPPVSVPQGSVVTVRVYGDAERFALAESVSGGAPPALVAAAEGIAVAQFEVARSGAITLAEGGTELGAWNFAMQPDAPPEIELDEPITRAPTGETQLAYVARDDHGVTAARAVATLDLGAVDRRYGLAVAPDPRAALAIDLPLPLSGDATAVAETLVEDFSKHPWAGLPVSVTLTAEDALGQSGAEDGITAILPGRRFYNPVAAALIEQRRDLLWSTDNVARAAQVLRAVTFRPEGSFGSERAYLATRIAIRRLDAARSLADPTAQIEDVAEMLWQAALLLEEGSLGDAAERLARAKERLQQALRSDASDEEIAQLMDELRQATREYMQQMAEEAIRNGEQQQADGGAPPPGQTMTQDQIQELMDRIQELSEQGRRAEAEALLEMLQQLLDNMEMQMAEGGQGQGGQGQQGEGGQSMQDLGDTLREQQDLADDSFQELQRQFREGRGQQSGQGQQGQGRQGEPQDGEGGDGPEGQSSAEALADRQEALRELLDQLQGDLPGDAGEAARQALREAERNMGDAGEDLRDGDTAGALDRQAEAIDNLRGGLREMAEAMRRAEAGARGGEPGAEGEASSDGRSDPLGRPFGAQGDAGTNERMLPEADAAARARGLLDEIRRRSGDQARPQLELDYLRRLLDRF